MNHQMASRCKKKKRAKKASSGAENTNRKDELKNDFWLPKIKRRRRFSSSEIKLLEREYKVSCSPSQDKIEEIADVFETNKKIITTWFQNRRAKNKKLQSLSPSIKEEEEGEEDYDDFDNDDFTEMSNDNTILSDNLQYYDSDTLHVINGNTALTTPTFTLHQQEHQHILSTLNSPHYRNEHLYDYFSSSRYDLYYYTNNDQEAAEEATFLLTSTAATVSSAGPSAEEFL